MKENEAKITIHQGKKTGEQLLWSDAICEKEYQYAGEATEAIEAFTWDEAEQVCNQKLDASFALLFKCSKKKNGSWEAFEERVLLYFAEEERNR